MATFSVRFLGCKVSHTDAHAIREALLADGHVERRAAPTSPSSTRAASRTRRVRKSRHAAARAARTHARVYVTGCAANLPSDAFAGLPAERPSWSRRSEETPAFVAGDVGAIGCVQADARLDRVRAFVKVQDGCSFLVHLLRDPARPRRVEEPPRRRRPRRGAPPRRAGPPRGRADGDQPRLLPRPRARRTTSPASSARRERPRASQRLRLSSIEVNHLNQELVAALRETPTVCRHLHVPLQSGDDGILRAMGRRYPPRRTSAARAARDDFNLTTDVIVGFPARGRAAFRSTLGSLGRGRDDEGARLPLLAAARHGDRRRRPGARRRSRASAAPGCALCRDAGLLRALARARSARRTSSSSTAPAAATGTTTRRGSSTAPVGELVPRACSGRHGGGNPRCLSDCLFCKLYREGDQSRPRRLRRDRGHQPAGATSTCSSSRSATSRRSATSPSSARRRRSACSTSSRRRRAEGLTDYRVVVIVRPRARARPSSTCTGTSSAGAWRLPE